jgi:CRP/FNR family transcriptional regulator
MPPIADAVARIMVAYPALADQSRALADGVRVQGVPAGSMLFDEGSACTGFPLLLAGSIRVAKASAQGREILLYRVQPGEGCVITGACLLGGTAYRARGVAESALELVVLPPALFETLLDQSPPFRRWVFALQAERLTALMARVESIAFQRVDARLAACLLERSAQGREPVHATHQDLADELGTVREIVTRALRQLADDGLVEVSREQVRVLDATALARRAAI